MPIYFQLWTNVFRILGLIMHLWKTFWATKMVFLNCWDMDMVLCVYIFNLCYTTQFDTLLIRKKSDENFFEKFWKFFWNFFQKLFFGSKWTFSTIEKKFFFEKIIFLKFHHFFRMSNVSNCVVLHKLKLQKTKCPYLINMLIPF